MIFADLECLLKNNNNLNSDLSSDNTYRIKESLHVPCGYGLYLSGSYDQNLLTHYRGIDCMKKFVTALKVIIKMISESKKANKKDLTSTEEYDFNYSSQCYLCSKKFKDEESNYLKHKVKDFCYYTGNFKGAAHRKCIDDALKEIEISIAFHNGSNYDYHFIIKEIAKEFDSIECIGENPEKYITFIASINKELNNGSKIKYKLRFIDTFKFTLDSLQNLVDNLTELNVCKKCNGVCNNYKRHNNILIYNCNLCSKKSYRSIDELIKKCPNVYSICNDDLDKFLLLLRKGVYPYEYMNTWNRFNECKNPPFEKYYSKLNITNITKEDYLHSQKYGINLK